MPVGLMRDIRMVERNTQPGSLVSVRNARIYDEDDDA